MQAQPLYPYFKTSEISLSFERLPVPSFTGPEAITFTLVGRQRCDFDNEHVRSISLGDL